MITRIIPFFLFYTAALSAQTRYYVSANAGGVQSGLSWADAYIDPQAALAIAQAGDSIWIAEGTYHPTAAGDRNASFVIPSGVRVFGGFAGHETQIEQRDPNSHFTVLSGDIGMAGDSSDNSINVVFMDTPGPGTELNGLVIRDGVANDEAYATSTTDRQLCGGGLYILVGDEDALPDLIDCRFEHNTAVYYGGGVAIYGAGFGSGAVRFTGCRFEGNRSVRTGGGLARLADSWIDRGPVLERCEFLNNSAGVRGGGLYYQFTGGSDHFITNRCVVRNNSAGNFGGGWYLYVGRAKVATISVQNAVFSENSSKEGAALGLYSNFDYFTGDILIDSCVIEKNLVFLSSFTKAIIYISLYSANGGCKERISECIIKNNNSNGKGTLMLAETEGGNLFQKNNLYFGNNVNTILNLSAFDITKTTDCIIKNNNTNFIIQASIVKTASFKNCLVSKNISNQNNGYFLTGVARDSLIFINNTFCQNEEIYYFGDYNTAKSPYQYVNIENTLIDTIPPDFFPFEATSGNYARAYLSHNYLPGFNCATANPAITCGPGNIFSGNPEFVDPEAGDFRLLPCSMLVNAGTDSAVAIGSTDLLGAPRIQGGRVDIGAYETAGPALSAAPLVRPACPDTASGAVQFQLAGGCPPFTVQWTSGSQAGQNQDGLAPGIYTFTLTDQRGATFSDTLTIPLSASPLLETNTTPVICGDTLGGSAGAAATSGNPPYQYRWADNNQTDAVRLDLPAGIYSVTVTDAYGCSSTGTAEVGREGGLQIDVAVTEISCSGAADGGFSLTPANGKAPFHWIWENGPHSPAYGPLGPGIYEGQVSDALGCTIQWVLPLSEPAPLSVSDSVRHATGPMEADGAIFLQNPTGGTQPWSFNWSNGQSGLELNNLLPGEYTVTMTDQHDCQWVKTITVPFTIGVSSLAGAENSCRLFPNPAPGGACTLAGTGAGAMRFEVLDATGRVLRDQTWTAPPGRPFERSMNLELSAGAYFWRMKAGELSEHGVLIVW